MSETPGLPPKMKPVWLVTSGAYVGQELAAEFGALPPSFLPVGVKRLYEYQLDLIGSRENIYITVPETYVISSIDRKKISDAGASVLTVPEGLSLGESLLFSLNLIAGLDRPVHILHGDTLLDEARTDVFDIIGTADSTEGYSWAEVELAGQLLSGLRTMEPGGSPHPARSIACGYFSFSSSATLMRSLARS